jgi:hypothetical protein
MPDNLSLSNNDSDSLQIDISGGGTSVTLESANATLNKAGLMSADDKVKVNTALAVKSTSIGPSQNLNTYSTTGIYIQDNNVNAGTGTNYPVNSTAGVLEVIGSGLFIWQKYHTYQGLNSNRTYTRSYYNGSWSAWKLLIDTSSITGTTNRTTATNGVIDIAATYVGQTSITTVGTIGAGTWNGPLLM